MTEALRNDDLGYPIVVGKKLHSRNSGLRASARACAACCSATRTGTSCAFGQEVAKAIGNARRAGFSAWRGAKTAQHGRARPRRDGRRGRRAFEPGRGSRRRRRERPFWFRMCDLHARHRIRARRDFFGGDGRRGDRRKDGRQSSRRQKSCGLLSRSGRGLLRRRGS